jgi:hypothetical protein
MQLNLLAEFHPLCRKRVVIRPCKKLNAATPHKIVYRSKSLRVVLWHLLKSGTRQKQRNPKARSHLRLQSTDHCAPRQEISLTGALQSVSAELEIKKRDGSPSIKERVLSEAERFMHLK